MNEQALSWWNKFPLTFDGTLIDIGIPIKYYGLMYIFAFATSYTLLKYLNKKERQGFTPEQLEGIATWTIGGVLVGARLGYVLFYNFSYYLKNPLDIIAPVSWDGNSFAEIFELSLWTFKGISGMSYHGGLIGAILFGVYYMRREKIDVSKLMNLMFSVVPIGYTWGRIGNYLNGELFGRSTDAAIGQVFLSDKTQMVRHPSQLYEAFFEGIVLFTAIWFLRKTAFFKNHVISIYIFGYGFFRFFIEYFREPDAHIGLNLLGLSRGQLLCIGMMLFSIGLWYYREKILPNQTTKK
ncbi:MAG: prolipoprotein diacylglyceryl transferase [Fibrobacterales bacterium]